METTIHDLANRANCSIKTISRVLNDQPYVRPELRARVQAAIAETGYTPNLIARRLVRGRPGTLALLLALGDPSFSSTVLAGVLDQIRESGYDLLLYTPSNQPADRDHLARLLTTQRLEGLVVLPPCDADPMLAPLLAASPLPRVFIDPLDRQRSSPFVAVDDLQGARELTTYLLDAGHHRIAFLKGPGVLRASEERLAGYTQALAQRVIPFETRLTAATEGTFEGGYNAVRIYLSEGARPTAFVAINDHTALGALFALQEMGVRVPREISVCGYGDLPLCGQIFPGLTSVQHPIDQLLTAAFRLLLQTIQGATPPQSLALLSPELVLRGSTGPAPGA